MFMYWRAFPVGPRHISVQFYVYDVQFYVCDVPQFYVYDVQFYVCDVPQMQTDMRFFFNYNSS